MAKNTQKTDETKDATATIEKVLDAAATVSAEQDEQGFIGVKVDPRPNSDYTLAGVTKKK